MGCRGGSHPADVGDVGEASVSAAAPEHARPAATPDDAGQARAASTDAAITDGAGSIAGTYDELTLGLDPDGDTVTGYFASGTGEDPATHGPMFRCAFYLLGALHGGRARIATWFPADRGTVVGGTLTVVSSAEIAIHLNEEHGGCWNVRHFADAAPATFARDTAGAWIAVRVVSAARAHFFAKPDGVSTQKAYVVRGDVVVVAERRGARPGGWVRARIGQTEGWLREADLFDDRAPLSLGDAGRAGACDGDLVWDTAARACRMYPGGPYGWAGCSLAKHPPGDFKCVTGAIWTACTCACDADSLFDPMTNTCH